MLPMNFATKGCWTKKRASSTRPLRWPRAEVRRSVQPSVEKGMKIMAIVDRHGLPLSVSTHAANHHEVRLVQLCFDFYMIEAKPENLIGDRAYDSDPLDAELRKDGAASGQPKQAAYARSAKVKPLHAPL